MVAVANAVSPDGVTPVSIVAGGEASGLANMVGQYLEQLLADSAEKRAQAAALRGRLGLCAREGDVAITIAFSEHGVAIEEGLQQPDAVVSGEIETLMHVLAGRANPAWELGQRRLAARLTVRRPLFGYQAYHLMRLPDAHLWSGMPHKVVSFLVGAAVTSGALLLLWRTRQPPQGDDDV